MTRRHFAWKGCNGVWKAVEENVSLPSGSVRKGKIAKRKKKGGKRGWADGEDRDGSEKKGIEERRKWWREIHRSTKTRREKKQNRRNGSADLSRTSFIFSPRLNIKDNLIIGGFLKTGRISPLVFLFPPSVFTSALHYHPLSLYPTVYPLEAWQENPIQIHVHILIPMCIT